MNKTKLIKGKSREIGFDLVGITSAEPFNKSYKRLKKIKDQDKLPPFIHKNIRLITRPESSLTGAKSIIAVAKTYNISIPDEEEAYVAQYARIPDYHKLMKEKLIQLSNFIKTIDSDIKTKIFCDTGPLHEKEASRRAGLGWIGKNSILINNKIGSFIVLGEILTTLKLAYDQPGKQLCGNCTICIDNCPANALDEPYVLNYKKCISYLTQKKGILTEKENQLIGSNLWGCDICQNICPYNNNIIKSKFETLIKIKLGKILEFKEILPDNWQKTALSWRGYEILIRNSLIVIGNNKYKKYYKKVKKLMNSRSQVIKHYAHRAYNLINK